MDAVDQKFQEDWPRVGSFLTVQKKSEQVQSPNATPANMPWIKEPYSGAVGGRR